MSTVEYGPSSNGIRSVVCSGDGQQPEAGWPLVVFLHGKGEAVEHYKDPRVGAMVHGPLWRRHRTGWQPPFVVLCPSLQHENDRWHSPASLDASSTIVDALLAAPAYAIDPERILLTGFSIGGLGCYALAWHWQSQNGRRARRMLPVDAYDPSPPWQHQVPENGIDVPTWSHYSQGNQTATSIEPLVAEVRRTESVQCDPAWSHPQVGRRTYERQDIYDWLLQV